MYAFDMFIENGFFSFHREILTERRDAGCSCSGFSWRHIAPLGRDTQGIRVPGILSLYFIALLSKESVIVSSGLVE